MSDLKPLELRVTERVLQMDGGYVLDFSNRTFAEFFDAELRVDIYADLWTGRHLTKDR